MQTVITSRLHSLLVINRFLKITLAMVMSLWLSLSGIGSPLLYAMNLDLGPVKGDFDTTISLGASLRLGDRDMDLVGVANGGNANSINYDNGNLNYDQGDFTSLNAKATHELELAWKNFGFFGRFYYFYDFAVMQMDTARTPLSHPAKREAGGNIKLLDAYLTGDFKIAGRPVSVRIGNQVLSWGESTFIQNGINIINPVDVSALRVAGSELREAFIPVPMISLNADITDNISVEAFYQLMWQNTEIEPEGTFFSANDFAGPGGSVVFIGFGRHPEADPAGPSDNPISPVGELPPAGGWAPREGDHKASDMGQGGIAFRFFVPELNDTEFGLYYIHYHHRLPLLSGRTPPPLSFPAQPVTPALVEWGLINGDAASNARYYREFPENIDLVGASFNADISAIGLAFQGEVSYRPNQPIQVDDVELLTAALSSLDEYFKTLAQLRALTNGEVIDRPDAIFANSQLCTYRNPNGIGTYLPNQDIIGYERKDMVQPQFTLTKMFGPVLGTDQLVMVGEFAATWFLGMEDKSDLRYDGPATYTSGNSFFTDANLQPVTTTEGFADSFSCGYRVAARADFNNAIGPVNLQPAVAFAHDIEGTTPLPIGNFVEDRMKITVALGANYLSKIQAKLAYTNFFGAGDLNLRNDRDFISLTGNYSF